MIKVGCCGFPTSMKKYFESFCLVEVNRTFYQYPRSATVEGWRAKAPTEFEFTVKAHQDISHKAKMKFGQASVQAFNRMKHICTVLNSKILLIQTPSSFRPDKLADAEEFFNKIDRENLFLVWETRGQAWENAEVHAELGRILEKLDISHVTDPFRATPVYTAEVAYFRLHGLGEQMYYYQYTDEELKRLKEIIGTYEKTANHVYVLFNNLSMFDDGRRFMTYLSSGVFPKITESQGLDSIRNVLGNTRFPVAKNVLMKRLGWRLVELEKGRRVRLESVLVDLPSKTYDKIEEVIDEIKTIKHVHYE